MGPREVKHRLTELESDRAKTKLCSSISNVEVIKRINHSSVKYKLVMTAHKKIYMETVIYKY